MDANFDSSLSRGGGGASSYKPRVPSPGLNPGVVVLNSLLLKSEFDVEMS